jgi:hypothetical protein
MFVTSLSCYEKPVITLLAILAEFIISREIYMRPIWGILNDLIIQKFVTINLLNFTISAVLLCTITCLINIYELYTWHETSLEQLVVMAVLEDPCRQNKYGTILRIKFYMCFTKCSFIYFIILSPGFSR